LALIGAVIGEFVGSEDGLGYLILVSTSQSRTPLAFAALVLLTTISVALYYGFVFIEGIAVPWVPKNRTRTMTASESRWYRIENLVHLSSRQVFFLRVTEHETRDSHCSDWSRTWRRDCSCLVATRGLPGTGIRTGSVL
jgi:hypothetical protein